MYSLMLHSNAEKKKSTNTLPKVIRIELILMTSQHQMIYLPQHSLPVLSISQEYACMHYAHTNVENPPHIPFKAYN